MPEVDVALAPGGALARWIPAQRWFANPSEAPALTVAGAVDLTGDGAVRTLLVRDGTPGAEALYQVPVVVASPGAEPLGLIVGDADDALIDGPRDRAYVDQLVELALGGGTVGDDVRVEGTPIGWTGPPPVVRSARVLSGEQSNTSVIVEAERADGSRADVIVKVFRAVHDGENPDVVLQSAIAAAGSRRVPATLGAVLGRWTDDAAPGGVARGHLAVAQEFLAGTEDAWRVALAAARRDEDFTGPARDLGAATAEVHRVLATSLPTREPDDGARAAARAPLAPRADRPPRPAPAPPGARAAITGALAAGTEGDWPVLQRVHGDYHLGQVLLVPDRGWVLLDFEGEPLRPMAERSEPDLALRDVAGMLRSFDYVAGAIEQDDGDAAAASAWAGAARAAFLAGYEEELGAPLRPFAALLTALELDKALYECEYEVRNRPGWLPIPERAVRRLLEASS